MNQSEKRGMDMEQLMRTASRIIVFALIVSTFAGCATTNQPIAHPVTAKDYCARGRYYQGQNQVDRAIPEYTQAIELDPNCTDAYYARGLCYYTTDLKSAIDDLTQVINRRPNEALYYRLRAGAYRSMEDFDLALIDCDKAIALRPNDYWPYLEKGGLLFSTGQYADAIPAYRVYLQKSPTVVGSMVGVGSQYAVGGFVGAVFALNAQLSVAREVASARASVTKQIQLCELMLRQTSPTDVPQAIVNGMSQNNVLQIVLATEKVIAVDPEWVVTVPKTGSLESRMLRIFVFQDDQLTLEKRVPLNEVANVPGTSTMHDIPLSRVCSKNEVLATVRKTDQVIYDDGKRIISVTEWEAVKGKRVRVFRFQDNKLTSWSFCSPRLW
jgi:tetratricopeptide (TPR) repeat protein